VNRARGITGKIKGGEQVKGGERAAFVAQRAPDFTLSPLRVECRKLGAIAEACARVFKIKVRNPVRL
jgi:hypothetical protein